MKFQKPALSIDQLVKFLTDKGLEISDIKLAEYYLQYIGYYRLKIYMRPFENDEKKFVKGTRFENIVDLYNFDRKLRLICLDAIERVEVALRAHVVNCMGVYGGPHFYEKPQHFERRWGNGNTLQIVAEANHRSISHYRDKYKDPANPPIWCVTEAISFGDLSRIYADLILRSRVQIAKGFKLDEKILVSWFKSIARLRNICAHHERLWNAELVVDAPMVATKFSEDLKDNKTCYSRLVILYVLLQSINGGNAAEWKSQLMQHIDDNPYVDLVKAGFPEDWKKRNLWI